ncbi:MAG: porin family protein [Burkholderiales bacterium]|nr:porin family protein [Burkholderiales bacterium]
MGFTFAPALRLLAFAGIALTSGAHAQTAIPGPWSVGIEGGAARLRVVCEVDALPCDRSGYAYGLSVARAFDRQWGARLSWTGTRRYSGSDRTASGVDYGGDLGFNVFGAAATWRMPVGDAQLELRAGLAAVDGDFKARAGGGPNAGKTTVQPLAGVALEYPLDARLALRVDAQLTRGKVAGQDGNLATFGLGLVARF